MKYEKPTITDHGSIAEHTFGVTSGDPDHPGQGNPGKDFRECDLDKFGEYSCPTS